MCKVTKLKLIIMIELFKNKEKSEYSEDIQMVHNEFMTAADSLLAEAKEIIKDTEIVNEEKVNRLKKLGFTASREVDETKDIIKKREMSKETARQIEYYKRNYPLNKFITESQVQEICKKYNLVYGKITRYTGFIPDKNLKQIENWKGLKAKDQVFAYIKDQQGNMLNGISEDDIKSGYLDIFKLKRTMYVYGLGTTNCKLVVDRGYGEFDSITLAQDEKLIIAAPIKDMKIDNTEEVKNYKIVKKHIPDPVVMQRCNGGFLILTAWGDEASDPLVVNEKSN